MNRSIETITMSYSYFLTFTTDTTADTGMGDETILVYLYQYRLVKLNHELILKMWKLQSYHRKICFF